MTAFREPELADDPRTDICRHIARYTDGSLHLHMDRSSIARMQAKHDAAALDAAAVYPGTWQEWEETFDPLGQVLEHYSFLQFRARSCAEAGHSLLLVFEEMADGAV